MSGRPHKGCERCNYTGERMGVFGVVIECECNYRRKEDPKLSEDAEDFLREAVDELNKQGRLF